MKFQRLIPFFIFTGFVWGPLIILPYDMFDGAIIQYASEVKDCSGLKIWFFEANYFLEYPLHCSLIHVGAITNISYSTVNAIFVLLVGFLLLREVSLFSKQVLKLKGFSALIPALIVSSTPVWSTLVASVLTFYFLCMTLGVLAVRLIHQRTKLSSLIGFVILAASFQYTSLLVFIPIFSYVYDALRENGNTLSRRLPLPKAKTFAVLATAVFSYLIFRIILTPTGIYEGYNNFQIPTNLEAFFNMAGHAIRFSTFLLPLTLIAGGLMIVFLTFKVATRASDTQVSMRGIILLFAVCIAAAFPYIVVGKSTTMISVWGWNARHAFLLSIAVGLLSGAVFNNLRAVTTTGWQRALIGLGASCIVGINLVLLSYGMIYKLNRQIFLKELSLEIAKVNQKFPSGYLQIIGDKLPGPPIRTWEANLLMFSTMGKANWWTYIGDQSQDWILPEILENAGPYRTKYVLDNDLKEPFSRTVIRIKVEGFDGRTYALQNFVQYVLTGKSNGLVKIESVISSDGLGS
jgi:hypothetical protein